MNILKGLEEGISMSDLLGIIVELKTFLSNKNSSVSVRVNDEEILELKEDRTYYIPDFQREIRWTENDIDVLVEDIKSGPRFLGNIILSKKSNQDFAIIDGQQRITILLMMLNRIKMSFDDVFEIIDPCKLMVESFPKFTELMQVNFDESLMEEDDLKADDKLVQRFRYKNLWEHLSSLDEIKVKRESKKFLENIGNSTFNVIVEESSDIKESIRCFIDVNLKGKQLDDEDIFKSYLFKNDSRKEVRKQWYMLKTSAISMNENGGNYSLLNILEHYFLCDLYKNNDYKKLEFGSNFLLKKDFKDQDGQIIRKGTHLIEFISDKSYMLESLKRLNKIISFMNEIVCNESVFKQFKDLFSGEGKKERIDNTEQKIIYNFVRRILKDKMALPKALLIKYFLTIFYGAEQNKKEKIRNVYAVFLFTVLFIIFENKKGIEALNKIIRANEEMWYVELMKQINEYFSIERITNARLLAQYTLSRNEDKEDYTFRCKSLAVIYNFFEQKDNKICFRSEKRMNDLENYLYDNEKFSTEHFIISQSKNKSMDVGCGEYILDKDIYNRYVKNFFNFIFIPEALNSSLENCSLPIKEKKLKGKEIDCDYSKMIIENAKKLSELFPEVEEENYSEKMHEFFLQKFQDGYIEYARKVLDEIIKQIQGGIE